VLDSPSPSAPSWPCGILVALSGSSSKEFRETFARSFFNSINDRMAMPNQSTNVNAARKDPKIRNVVELNVSPSWIVRFA
jgi:hypothetical protein